MAQLDPRLVAMLRRMRPAARNRALAWLRAKMTGRTQHVAAGSALKLPLVKALLPRGSRDRQPPQFSTGQSITKFVGKQRSFAGPLVTQDSGTAVAAGIETVLDREARSVLGDVPGGTAVLNAVEGAVSDFFKPTFSGGVTPAEAAYIAAGSTPVEKAARVASVEGRTGEKQVLDPMSPSGYRNVGGGNSGIRGVPRGFEAEALED